jgi:hypothetical protein
VKRAVVAVDLAAKYSATVRLDSEGAVQSQWDSLGVPRYEVARRIYGEYTTALAQEMNDHRPLVVVEDVPPRNLPGLRPVLQLQGRILQEFAPAANDVLFFVVPAEWQQSMGVYRVNTEVAEEVAIGYGYVPPDLLAQRVLEVGTRGQAAAIREAVKQRTDYVSAFLMARWAWECVAHDRKWHVSRVRQYE